MFIPKIEFSQPRQPGERSISTWKTKKVADTDGRRYVKITEGSDGNKDVLNRVVQVVRYEYNGEKTIFKL